MTRYDQILPDITRYNQILPVCNHPSASTTRFVLSGSLKNINFTTLDIYDKVFKVTKLSINIIL